MNARTAKSETQDKESPNFMGLFKRRMGFSVGFLSLFLAINPINDNRLKIPTPNIEQEAPNDSIKQIVEPANTFNYGISLSVDCFVTPANKGGSKFSWTNEAHRPLGLAISSKGAGSEPYLVMGQRANGSSKDAPPQSGWIMAYDKNNRDYIMYAFDVQERLPEGVDKNSPDAKPIAHVVADPIEIISVDDIEKGISYQFGDALLSIQHEPGNLNGPLHFNLTCQPPSAPRL